MTGPGRVRLRVTRVAAVWLLVAAVLVGVGWYKTINLLLLLGYTLVAVLVVNVVMARRAAGRVRATLHPVPPCFPGEAVAVTIDVTNPSARLAVVRVEVAGVPAAAWLFVPLAAGESRTVTAPATFPARGVYPVGPVEADAAVPVGLVHAVRALTPVVGARVLPAPGTADADMLRRWLIRGGAGDGPTRRPNRRPAPGTGDVRGLRPYRTGDSPRDIHWRSTARRGQLLVREYDRAEPLDLVIVVDPYLPAGGAAGDARRLEWCLSLAMTLGLLWAAADAPADVTLVVALPGGPRVVTGRATPRFVRSAFAVLADVTGAEAVSLARPGVTAKRAARLLVSPRDDSPLLAAYRTAGRSLRAVTPGRPPGWFTPPG